MSCPIQQIASEIAYTIIVIEGNVSFQPQLSSNWTSCYYLFVYYKTQSSSITNKVQSINMSFNKSTTNDSMTTGFMWIPKLFKTIILIVFVLRMKQYKVIFPVKQREKALLVCPETQYYTKSTSKNVSLSLMQCFESLSKGLLNVLGFIYYFLCQWVSGAVFKIASKLHFVLLE